MSSEDRKDKVERLALAAAEEAALSFCDTMGTMDMGRFTEDEGRAFIFSIIDAYSLEILKTWSPEQIRRVGIPAP